MKKQLRIKPYKPYDPDSPPKPRSEAQRAAHRRTWRIIQLRSLWVLAYSAGEVGRAQIRAIIDHELLKLGAEPHSVRVERERVELHAQLQAEQDARLAAIDIPF